MSALNVMFTVGSTCIVKYGISTGDAMGERSGGIWSVVSAKVCTWRIVTGLRGSWRLRGAGPSVGQGRCRERFWEVQ